MIVREFAVSIRFLWLLVFFLFTTAALAAERAAPETYGDAMRWYRIEADKGYSRAQFLLGYMYETGYVYETDVRVPRDPVLARAWYAKAAAQNERSALYRLARMYHEGRGGSVDLGQAARLYRAAAERGHVGAQSMLGYLYAVGEGVERDGPQAYLWLSLAARAGNAAAAENLSRLEAALDATQAAAGRTLETNWSPTP